MLDRAPGVMHIFKTVAGISGGKNGSNNAVVTYVGKSSVC